MKKNSTLQVDACQKTAQLLAQLLSDTYLLYVKTQNFHWNIVDPRFYALHKMLEEQYEELAEAVDMIAERIRALGLKAPGSMRQFLEMTMLEEAGNNLSGNAMLEQLFSDHQAIARSLYTHIEESSKLGDEGTADLFIQRLRAHEKTAWMLRSLLK